MKEEIARLQRKIAALEVRLDQALEVIRKQQKRTEQGAVRAADMGIRMLPLEGGRMESREIAKAGGPR